MEVPGRLISPFALPPGDLPTSGVLSQRSQTSFLFRIWTPGRANGPAFRRGQNPQGFHWFWHLGGFRSGRTGRCRGGRQIGLCQSGWEGMGDGMLHW